MTVSEAEIAELVGALVAIDSTNPDLVPGGAGETEIAGFVAAWLDRAGLEVELVEPVPGRPSVVGHLPGRVRGRSLMLNAHLDTVGAGAMADPHRPRVESGRLHGRGAYDMKASLAAILLSARELAADPPPGDVLVAAVADEEVASLGTAAVLERFTCDTAIVTEPTELRLCLAHKGFAWIDVESTGVAAHGSRADLGIDAISALGPVLAGLAGLGQELAARPAHRLVGTGSVHASLIQGGSEMSTYPGRCLLQIERRTIPGEDAASVLAEVEQLAAEARAALPGARVEVRLGLVREPSELDSQHPWARVVAEAATGRLGSPPPIVGVPYWMDMALLNAAGIACLALGPSGAGAHADQEWVDLASVAACADIYQAAARTLGP